MKCKFNGLVTVVICLLCLHHASSEPPKPKHHPRPLVFKSWPPPSRNAANMRAHGMMLKLRGSGSSNIVSRVPAPGMFIKTASPFRFALPASRPGSLQSSPSNHIFFKSNGPQASALKRPYAAHLTSPGVFKFSSPGHKTAIKFQPAPPVPLRSKPEFIYEKVNAPKHPDPVRYTIGSDGAIHTIAAPNLASNDIQTISEVTANHLNSQFDSDLTKFNAQAFAINKPTHTYQVRENTNDISIQNTQTGHKTYYAPDNDPALKTSGIHPINDPLNVPSDGQPKPSDVLYHQSLDFAASPLVQGNHFTVDPFSFPVTAQPQLQQYHLLQNTMLKQGMPLASLNPTYLVMQSNNLLGQHQQHLTSQLFRPENGYIDTSITAQPNHATFSGFDYTSPQQAASLGQIYSAQKDQLQHDFAFSTQAPSTAASYYDGAASQSNPSFTQLLEPKPNHYQHSPQNFIDLPEEHLSSNDIQNLINYNQDLYQDYYNQRQIENDVILREAQEKLEHKLNIQQQQQQTAYDLHQLVQQEKYHPLRIVVADEEHVQFQRRADPQAIEDESDEYEDEDPENYESAETTETNEIKSSKKNKSKNN